MKTYKLQQSFKIPLRNVPQRFNMSLLDQDYIVETAWNDQGKNWEISFFDESKNPILTNLPLVCGVDLLYQHRHILPASLVCYTQGDNNAIPTYENLGKDAQLYFMVTV